MVKYLSGEFFGGDYVARADSCARAGAEQERGEEEEEGGGFWRWGGTKELRNGGTQGKGGGLLPVVGDQGEVLEVDEAVEVEVAGGPGLLGGLPVVGDEGLVQT